LDRLEDALRGAQDPTLAPKRQELASRADQLRRRLLDDRIDQLLRRPIPDTDPSDLWARRFLLTRLQAEVEATFGDDGPSDQPGSAPEESLHRRQVAALEQRRAELADTAADRLRALDPEARRQA